MHNTFNGGKNPGTQKLCQLPSQWVEIAGDFAGVWENEYIKARKEHQNQQLLEDRRVETKS